jgi:hypothetical protein
MLLIWLGVLTEADNTKTSDINENEQDDLGVALIQVSRISFFSNINADIRSIEVFSPEDMMRRR